MWASYASLDATRSITVAYFIPDLISLLLLFSLASSALPDELQTKPLDLGDYYRANRKWFWGLFALYTLWVTLVAGVRASVSGTPPIMLIGIVVPNLFLASLMLVLVAVERKWVHMLVIGLLLLTSGLAWLPQELAQS